MRINKQDRITVKKAKVARSLSQETTAYTADVYFDGKKIAYAHNNGCGGITCLDLADREAVDAYRAAVAFARTLAYLAPDGTQETDGHGKPAFATLDEVVDMIVEDEDLRKSIASLLKRSFKKSVVFFDGDTERHSKAPPSEPVYAALRAKYPNAEILNLLPLEEAIDKYIEVSNRIEAKRIEALEGRFEVTRGG